MKNKFLTFIFIFILTAFFSNNLIALAKPKGNTIGAIAGKIYIEFGNDWKTMYGSTLYKGKYYIGQILLINKATNKKYFTETSTKGFYYFVNLEPGNYFLKEYSSILSVPNTTFTIEQPLDKSGIDITVYPNKITGLRTVKIFKEVLPKPDLIQGDTFEKHLQPMKTNIYREDDFYELQLFFNKADFTKKWSNYIWVDENGKTENNIEELKTAKQGDVITFNDIIFYPDVDDIKEESYPLMDQIVNVLNERKDVFIEINGYTNSTGNPESELQLSAKRALKVASYLIKKDIKADRIKTKGNGALNLKQENIDEANRRVEIKIIKAEK